MKKIIFILSILFVVQAHAQDSSKTNKPKTFLGVLTLMPKYQDDKNWTPADEAIVGEHFKRLVQKKAEGIVVLAGRTDLASDNPDMMGLVIFYAKDEQAALQFMQDDPAVKAKIMKTKVHPYGIAISKCEQ